MAKKKKVSRATGRAKKNIYHPATYGISYDSFTFLIFAVFVLVMSIWLVSSMMGIRIF